MKLKVCGMKNHENILKVAKLSPDFMGFIFYAGSKRFVGNDFVMPEISPVIKKVGVFVNESLQTILDKVKKYNLDLVQLHGDETAEFCDKLFQSLKLWRSSTRIMKAFGIDPQFNFSVLHEYENFCDYFLFDSKTNEYGGSGIGFDKDLLKNYKLSKPYFISGGVESVPMPNTQYPMPFAIDVNSRFETAPGIKDISKLKILKDEISGK